MGGNLKTIGLKSVIESEDFRFLMSLVDILGDHGEHTKAVYLHTFLTNATTKPIPKSDPPTSANIGIVDFR